MKKYLIVSLFIIVCSFLLLGCSEYSDTLSYVRDNYNVYEVYDKQDILSYVFTDCQQDVLDYVLDNHTDYILNEVAGNYNIEDLYEESYCDDWACDYVSNHYYYDLNWVFTDEEITEYAHDFYFPNDIYSDEELLEWYEEYMENKRGK